MLAGGFILVVTAVPVVGAVAAALSVPKAIGALVILRESGGHYRPHTGEGDLSQHYDVRITTDSDEVGSFVNELTPFFGELRALQGLTLSFSKSEYLSVWKLKEALQSNPFYRQLLKLHEASHRSQDGLPEGTQEIAFCIVRLQPTVSALADFLTNHDGGRVRTSA